MLDKSAFLDNGLLGYMDMAGGKSYDELLGDILSPGEKDCTSTWSTVTDAAGGSVSFGMAGGMVGGPWGALIGGIIGACISLGTDLGKNAASKCPAFS